jgi:hypothetical protein
MSQGIRGFGDILLRKTESWPMILNDKLGGQPPSPDGGRTGRRQERPNWETREKGGLKRFA